MASASKSSNLYDSYNVAFPFSVSFTESMPSTSKNTSQISISGSLKAETDAWESSYNSTLGIGWHDDRNNQDIYVSEIYFNSLAHGVTKTVTGSIEVTHKEDGTLNGYAFVYFVRGGTSPYSPYSGSLGTDLTALDSIARYPLITSAPNFTDEENPTIQYTTTMGFEGATVEACIKTDLSGSDIVPYRQVTVEDGNYTFNLTNTERNALRNATPNSKNLTVYFVLRTTTQNNEVYASNSQKTMTIVNASPYNQYSTNENNPKVTSIVGGMATNYVIQNASQLVVNSYPTAQKGATISSVRVTSDSFNKVMTSSPYSCLVPIKSSGSIGIAVSDSRGFTRVDTINKTLISYIPVSIKSFSFVRESPTSSNIILNFEGKYHQTTILGTTNSPTIKWKLGNGTFQTIPSSNYVINTSAKTIKINNYRLTNALSYTSQGQFTIKIEDMLTEAQDSGEDGFVTRGITVFDYGEHDLKVNGDLFIADTSGQNPINVLDRIKWNILWENQNPTSNFASQNITLSNDNYDMLLWILKRQASADYLISVMTIGGYNAFFSAVDGSGETVRRGAVYVSSTEFSVGGGTVGAGTSGDEWLVPLYIIGIKTGLF